MKGGVYRMLTPEEWEISGAYICEVITVRLIQQYE